MESSNENPKHWVDISTGELLLGRAALGAYIDSGGHPADIFTLRDVLKNDSLELPTKKTYHRINGWQKDECIENLRWISKEMGTGKRSPREKIVNESVLRRASYLGIIASPDQISHKQLFGSLSNLYKEANIFDSHREFYNITDEEIVSYITDLIAEYGRLPSVREIRQRARNDASLVNYETIYTRFGGLKKAAEKGGWRDKNEWSPKKCVSWGVAFKIANGRLPTQEDIKYLSTQNLVMSDKTLAKKFKGGLPEFKREVQKIYKLVGARPNFMHKFYYVKGGSFVLREWVTQLRIPSHEDDATDEN